MNDLVLQSDFCTPQANSVLSNIVGYTFSDDCSLTTTLRALLAGRIPDTTKVYVYKYVDKANVLDYLNYYLKDNQDDTLVNVIKTDNQSLTRDMSDLKNAGFKEIPSVASFFIKYFKARAFIREETHDVFLFLNSNNISTHHKMQSAIPVILPWFFKEKPLNDIEVKLLKALTEDNLSEYTSIVSEIAKKYDFRTQYIMEALTDINKLTQEREISALKSENHDAERQIQDYDKIINDILERIRTNRERLYALENNLCDSDTELADYFIANKCLDLMSVNANSIKFKIKTYIEYFDESAVESWLSNPNSLIFKIQSGANDREITEFIRAVFLERKIKIRITTGFQYVFHENVYGVQLSQLDMNIDSIQNAHIKNHNCMGDYRAVLTPLIRSGQHVPVIEQCIASAKSMNWHDTVVVREFLNDIYRCRCMELPDGQTTDLRGAIDWIEREDKE